MSSWRNIRLSRRLLTYIMILLLAAILLMGAVSYILFKQALDNKGRTILENSVVMAMAYIDESYGDYEKGNLTYEEALEDIRSYLNGNLGSNGLRDLNTGIDLGEHGYFIIYGVNGDAIMHPNLEDQNLWDVVDPTDNTFYIVRSQIESALHGDGYLRYAWNYPNTDQIGRKITFSAYQSDFKWVVVASTYESDFNSDARNIFGVMIFAAIIFSFLGMVGARMFISSITGPMGTVLEGMKDAERGYFTELKTINRNDEVGQLIRGFNQMSSAIALANDNVRVQAERITFLAYNDVITELPNRHRFSDYVNGRIDKGIGMGYVLQLDIKDFKIVNSTVGSDLGDVILRRIGQSFFEIKDEKSMIARTSGNEFSIWFEDLEEQVLADMVDMFKRKLVDRLEKDQISQPIEFHYAYATYPESGQDFDTLYKHASIAMKYAKENRDLRVYRFENAMLEAIESNLKMTKLLEYAIFNQEITVAYQQKVSIETGIVTGVEALARWYSSTLGYVSPAIFITAINHSNLAATFGQYMLEQVFFEYPFVRRAMGEQVKVAINISPLFFMEKQFVNIVEHAREKFDIDPTTIVFEITEDIFINDLSAIKETVSELRAMGYTFSLDDFGTGYSSLNYLKNIDISEVKVDKSFIDRMIKDEKTMALLEAIRKITSAYGYALVAEGVETLEQVEILKSMAYDTIQGYYYSKPEPIPYLEVEHEQNRSED